MANNNDNLFFSAPIQPPTQNPQPKQSPQPKQNLPQTQSAPFTPLMVKPASGTVTEEKLPNGIQGLMAHVDRTLTRSYLTKMELAWPCGHLNAQDWIRHYTLNQDNIALYKLNHFVFTTDEDVRERLKTFYSALHGLSGHPSIFFILDSRYDSKTHKTEIDFYLGIRMQEARDLNKFSTQFRDLLTGYFPGTQVDDLLNKEQIATFQERILRMKTPQIACVSAQASPQKDSNGNPVLQGLEGLADVMLGHSYTAILIAQCVSPKVNASRQRTLENLYTHLSSLQKITTTYSTSENTSLGFSISEGITDGTSSTVTRTEGYTESSGSSHTETRGSSTSFSDSSTSESTSYSTSTSYGFSSSESYSDGQSHSVSVTQGVNTSRSQGVTQGINVETTNKAIVELLKRLDITIDQHEQAISYGSWDCAAYFIANQPSDALLAANTYKSLICGDESSLERPYLALWNSSYGALNYDGTGIPRQSALLFSILNGMHPLLRGGVQSQPFAPTATINGNSLPYFLSLPLKSIPGVVVDQMAAFERSVLISSSIRPAERLVKLGDVYHLGQRDGSKSAKSSEEGRAVELDLDAFTGHCLVTGSTGSGKSNTIGVLLNRFYEKQIPFLVIEPAKGEYRSDFAWVKQYGSNSSQQIHVFTTNPLIGRLLRINPFRFPETTHVLEHIDRLLVIFNSCWEMTEAMPALLKKAVERAYLQCGWRLEQSRCRYTPLKFPTFYTLVQTLREVIDESEYDERGKKIYKGALLSRIESLSTGLSGAIFAGERDIEYPVLFGENCIVDLSRLGSAETKSLIMGVLVMALNEYRIDESLHNPKLKNAKLRHVTILEEAHNLLRNSAQIAGGASATIAKSIESLSNAIAEMRTYGEGFLIVDQSPGALDISATRNTNTKIVMRLPEQQDCEAMAKALALEDVQGKEIAKLNPGVAVVFQNTWRAPVLTLVDCAPQHPDVAVEDVTSTAEACFKLNCHLAYQLTAMLKGFMRGPQPYVAARAQVRDWLKTKALETVCTEVAPTLWSQYEADRKAKTSANTKQKASEESLLFNVQPNSVVTTHKQTIHLPLAYVAIEESFERYNSLVLLICRSTKKREINLAFGASFADTLGLQNEWRELLRDYRKTNDIVSVMDGFYQRLTTEFGFPDDRNEENKNAQYDIRMRKVLLLRTLLCYYEDRGVLISGGSSTDEKEFERLTELVFKLDKLRATSQAK